ncbi:hypothetical protein EAY39_08100 [Vibrio anguillarum]|uniref:N-6 DNA methylase n=2 Tax=Vibrio anguillarum TaxID=55601 RepID=UPI0018C221C3|nr:N-6 DNA methylase [Vibrio anguillarum]MBF4340750.1 hypothetical protein [Vibrio anguillarum]
MFATINTDPKIQFPKTCQELLSQHKMKDLDFFRVIEGLSSKTTERKNDWESIYRGLVSDPHFGVDYFAALNQERSTRTRSFASEYFTPSMLADHLAIQVVPMVAYLLEKNLTKHYRVIEPSCGTGAILMRFIRAFYLYRPDLLSRIEFIANDISMTNIEATKLNYQVLIDKGLPLKPLVTHRDDALALLPLYQGTAIAVIGNPPFHDVNTSCHSPESYLPCHYSAPFKFAADRGEIPFDSISAKDTKKKNSLKAKVSLDVAITEMSVRLLAPFGVSALIVPNGILSNSKDHDFRKLLITGSTNQRQTRLLSVQAMPTLMFKHSGTGVQTSLLLITNSIKCDGVYMSQFDSCRWDSRLNPKKDNDFESNEIKSMYDNIVANYKNCIRQYVAIQGNVLSMH